MGTTAKFSAPTRPTTVCAPEMVWEHWQQDMIGVVPSIALAATLLRWLQLTSRKRVDRLHRWVRKLPRAAWWQPYLQWRTVPLPRGLADAASRKVWVERSHNGQAGWWSAAMLDITMDDAGYVAADGTPGVDAGSHALEQLAIWVQQQTFIDAMEAAGCDMSEFDPLAEVPTEGAQLSIIRKRRR